MTKILWFTGLSGSGKSTIAEKLEKEFSKRKKSFTKFDGDDVRKKFHKHLGFTQEDIIENNRLILELCKKEIDNFDYILVPIISPFKLSRDKAREEFEEKFIEIYVKCDYKECKKRDVKGLYKKAEDGELKNFIGLHIPYEIPLNPEIILNTSEESVKQSVDTILEYLKIK
jgi:adenylylsulfate kinase